MWNWDNLEAMRPLLLELLLIATTIVANFVKYVNRWFGIYLYHV